MYRCDHNKLYLFCSALFWRGQGLLTGLKISNFLGFFPPHIAKFWENVSKTNLFHYFTGSWQHLKWDYATWLNHYLSRDTLVVQHLLLFVLLSMQQYVSNLN